MSFTFTTGMVYDEITRNLKLKISLVNRLNRLTEDLNEEIGNICDMSIENIFNDVVYKYYEKRALILGYGLKDQADVDNFITMNFHETLDLISNCIAYDYYFFKAYKDEDLVLKRRLLLRFSATPDGVVKCDNIEFVFGDPCVDIILKLPHYFKYKAEVSINEKDKGGYKSNVVSSELIKKKYFKFTQASVLNGLINYVYEREEKK